MGNLEQLLPANLAPVSVAVIAGCAAAVVTVMVTAVRGWISERKARDRIRRGDY